MSSSSTRRNRNNVPPEAPLPEKRRWRLRSILLFAFIGLWLTVLGTWFVLHTPAEWESLLVNLEFSKAGSALFGSRKASGTSDLAYFGDGKAELGDFSIKIYDPLTSTSVRSDFHLEGNTVFGDQEAFDDFMRTNRRLFREQVTVAMRACSVRDLANPDLKLLEKKLASRVNRAIGRKVLKSVRISDHALYESANNVFVPMEGASGTP